jgi:hypothetical protein
MVGYYQAQATTESGLGASNRKDSVTGIGPEVTFVCPKLGVATSIRYFREAGASNRPQGNTVNIILTKRLGPNPK